MAFKKNDFIKIEFDIYANGKLVQTTDEKKGKEAGLEKGNYGPMSIILGKEFILKALDEEIIKTGKKEGKLDLTPENAYGKRKKEYLKVFPKSAFDEMKLRPVPGITYDFNGMYGTVKSVVGGRVMVDFNNPLAGKDIHIDYKNVSLIEDITEKISLILEVILKVPQMYFNVTEKNKEVLVELPKEISSMGELLEKSFKEMLGEEEYKKYKFKFQEKENKPQKTKKTSKQ